MSIVLTSAFWGRGVRGGRAHRSLMKRARVELSLYLDVDMDMFPLRFQFTLSPPCPLNDAGFQSS